MPAARVLPRWPLPAWAPLAWAPLLRLQAWPPLLPQPAWLLLLHCTGGTSREAMGTVGVGDRWS